MTESIYVKSIWELHQNLGYEAPKHPLITIFDLSKTEDFKKFIGYKIVTDFYIISMKEKCFGKLLYGRNTYDFQEGVLAFIEPGQNFVIEEIYKSEKQEGFMMFIHPELLRKKSLFEKIRNYSFFSYSTSEALHLSDKEKETVKKIISDIMVEIDGNMDNYTNELIVSNIELLLNYSKRFYNRQFLTRENLNKSVIEEFKKFLSERINGNLSDKGIPTVKECAEYMCYSPNYLSDMLKKETGKNTKEYISLYLMDKAKILLLDSDKSVNEIAYNLGFEYPEHFSKMFKNKEGVSPLKYRISGKE